LLLGHGELADFEGRINVSANAFEEFGGASVASAPADGADGRRLFESEGDIFSNGQIGKKRGLLVDGGDAGGVSGGRSEALDLLPAYFDGAGIRLVSAGNNFDECGFPSAIFAEERMNLAGLQVK